MSSSSQKKPGSNAREWVLVIDDEAPLRQLVADCFEGSGVEVIGGGDAGQALQLLAARSDEPVLALIDVLMPGVDGLTLAKKLHARFKHGSIVVMSGHLSDVSWWPVELRDVAFLSKPFRLDQLNELLATARAAYPRES